jgi:BRCA1-associated RING domain protein 1
VLLGSGLDSLGKEQLRSLGALCGATIADKWNPRVTHVICGAGGANAAYPGEKTARRTFKYLMGVLHGRWVLTQDWVNAQLSSKKKVDETAYQVEKDGVGCACGAAASKAAAIAGCSGSKNAAAASHMLLRGFEVQLQGEFANKSQMIDLIKAAGGKVVSRLPTTGASTSGTTNNNKKKSNNKTSSTEVGGVVLVEVPDTSEAVAAGFKAAIVGQTWFSKAVETGVPVASHRWLTDSISTFQLAPLDKFLFGSS